LSNTNETVSHEGSVWKKTNADGSMKFGHQGNTEYSSAYGMTSHHTGSFVKYDAMWEHDGEAYLQNDANQSLYHEGSTWIDMSPDGEKHFAHEGYTEYNSTKN
jgi:hypothetical protein